VIVQQFLNSSNLLDLVEAEAQRNSATAKEFASLDEGRLNWKPTSDQWSIAECLEHLTISMAAYKPIMNRARTHGGRRFPAASAPPYRPTWMGGWLIRHVSPDSPKKLTAPKVFRPPAVSSISGSLGRFIKEQDEFIKFVRESAGMDYNKVRLRSPVTPLVRYSLADAFVVIVVHAQRHLLQAQRVRSAMEINFRRA
jgi:hypothetical protein